MDSEDAAMGETHKDRNRFTDSEREAYLKYQEAAAALPEGWITRFEICEALEMISNEAHLHYPDAIWAAAIDTVRLQHPSHWRGDAGRAPIAAPLIVGTLVAIGDNMTAEDEDPMDAAMAAKEWIEKTMVAIEVHWVDPEPARVFEIETNAEGDLLDIALLVALTREVLARVLTNRSRTETLDTGYRRMIDYKGREYANRMIAHLRAIGALGPRPTLRCTTGKTVLLAREDYMTLSGEHEFACSNPECGCEGRGKAKMPPWEELIQDGFVEGGQVAVHIRSEETREGNWVRVALNGSPSEVESGEFSHWLTARNERYGFKVCEDSDVPIRRLEAEGAA